MRLLRLRTLTEKSTLSNFGEMAIRERTVGRCLQSPNHKWALISAYYNKSKISFVDNVLNKLGITAEWRIIKPGINKEIYVKFRNSNEGYEIQLAKATHGHSRPHQKLRNAEKNSNLSKSALRDNNRRYI